MSAPTTIEKIKATFLLLLQIFKTLSFNLLRAVIKDKIITNLYIYLPKLIWGA